MELGYTSSKPPKHILLDGLGVSACGVAFDNQEQMNAQTTRDNVEVNCDGCTRYAARMGDFHICSTCKRVWSEEYEIELHQLSHLSD